MISLNMEVMKLAKRFVLDIYMNWDPEYECVSNQTDQLHVVEHDSDELL